MFPYHPFRSEKAKAEYLAHYDSMAEDWPVASESRMLGTSYGQTFVRISGPPAAKPLVLLSGIGSNSLMWIPNIEALSDWYRTYAVDNIYDCGRSVYIKACRNADDFTNWLDELFDALELGDNISILGMSYGSWLTSQFALRFPERLDKIILLAPAATVMRVRLDFFVGLLLCILPIPYFTRRFIYRGAEDLVKKNPLAVEETVRHSLLVNQSYKSKRIIAPTVLKDRELESINVPTLVLIGENESIYSAEKAMKRLSKVAPQIKTEIVPDAGHDITVVQAELVNTRILEFLKGTP